METNELSSVEAFAEYLLADERTSFRYEEAKEVAENLHVLDYIVIRALKEYGFIYEGRDVPKPVRGFRTSSNDRYFGPGACKSHGGSGWEQITGFAGQKG